MQGLFLLGFFVRSKYKLLSFVVDKKQKSNKNHKKRKTYIWGETSLLLCALLFRFFRKKFVRQANNGAAVLSAIHSTSLLRTVSSPPNTQQDIQSGRADDMMMNCLWPAPTTPLSPSHATKQRHWYNRFCLWIHSNQSKEFRSLKKSSTNIY